MAKKKKTKKVKPIPVAKKQQRIYMSPGERARHLREIQEILQNAKKKDEARIENTKLGKDRSFTIADIESFIGDLKFKSPEENKKPNVSPHTDRARNILEKSGQSAGVASDNVTTTYYDRWFRLVSTKPVSYDEPVPIEISNAELVTLPKAVSSTIRSSYNLYKEELTVNEIAEKRKLSVSTIYSHLCELVEMGVISVYELLNNNKIKDITHAINKVGGSTLSEIKAHCPSSISYDEIKLMLAHLKKKK